MFLWANFKTGRGADYILWSVRAKVQSDGNRRRGGLIRSSTINWALPRPHRTARWRALVVQPHTSRLGNSQNSGVFIGTTVAQSALIESVFPKGKVTTAMTKSK